MPQKLTLALKRVKKRKSKKIAYSSFISDTYLALYSALHLAFRHVHKGFDLSVPGQQRGWRGLLAMTEWLVSVSVLERPTLLTKAIKEWATQAQAVAAGTVRKPKDPRIPALFVFLQGSIKSQATRKNLWVFANVGRSLPPPPNASTREGKRLRDDAAAQWKERLTTKPGPLDPTLLQDIERFVYKRTVARIRRFERKRGAGQFTGLGPIKLNAKACLERSRKKKGVYGHYKEMLQKSETRLVQVEKTLRLDRMNDPYAQMHTEKVNARILATNVRHWVTEPSEDDSALRADLPKRQRTVEFVASIEATVDAETKKFLAGFLAATGRLPSQTEYRERTEPSTAQLPMKYLLLPERGNKLRGATISPAFVVVQGQRINAAWISLLATSKCHSYTLSGSTGLPRSIKQGIERNGLSEDFILTSADLSAASDYIHHQAAWAVWRGYTRALEGRLPEFIVELGYLLVGGRMRNIPDGDFGNTQSWYSQRGALMGIPLAWPVLSELQDFCAHKACKAANISGSPYVICGDDLGAAWTEKAQKAYYDMLFRVDLRLNAYKTYESRTGLVFVERLFVLSHPTSQPGEKALVPVLDPQSEEGRKLQAQRRLTSRTDGDDHELWSWIRLELVNKLEREGKMAPDPMFSKFRIVPRPKLSALIAAKRRGNERQDEQKPHYLSLAGTIAHEYDLCAEPWRKEAALSVARTVHHKIFAMWSNSGLPLHWPTELGGWGLPGKQTAPPLFRKAAAAILTGQDKLGQEIARMRLLTSAPDATRSILKDIFDEVSTYPERLTPEDEPTRLSVLQQEITAKVIAYRSWDPSFDKTTTNSTRWSMKKLCHEITAKVNQAAVAWRGVHPVNPKNLQKLIRRRVDKMVTSTPVDSLLFHTNAYDETTDYLVGVTPRVEPAAKAAGVRPSEAQPHDGVPEWLQVEFSKLSLEATSDGTSLAAPPDARETKDPGLAEAKSGRPPLVTGGGDDNAIAAQSVQKETRKRNEGEVHEGSEPTARPKSPHDEAPNNYPGAQRRLAAAQELHSEESVREAMRYYTGMHGAVLRYGNIEGIRPESITIADGRKIFEASIGITVPALNDFARQRQKAWVQRNGPKGSVIRMLEGLVREYRPYDSRILVAHRKKATLAIVQKNSRQVRDWLDGGTAD
jgi:hypothetical protein